MAKICCVCSTDVSGKKRVKDPQGNYYCEPCYNAKTAEKKSAPQEVAVAAAHAAAPATAPAAEPVLDDMGMLDLAEDVKDQGSVDTAMFGCADCKKLVPEKNIRNDDGEFICSACFAKRKQANRPGAPKTRSLADQQKAALTEGDSSAPGFADSVVGGLLFTVASIAGTFALVMVIQFIMALPMPAPSEGHTLADGSSAMGVGIMYSAWHLGFAIVTWLSALIAVKVTGGKQTFGAVIWKSFALTGGITVFFRITDQWFLGYVFGIIPCVFFGIRYTALSTGIGALLSLDGMAKRLVALVAMLFSEFMGFIFYAFMLGLIATQVIHTDVKALNDEDFTPQEKQDLRKLQEKLRGNGDQAPDENAPAAPAPAPEGAQPQADQKPADAAPAPAPEAAPAPQ